MAFEFPQGQAPAKVKKPSNKRYLGILLIVVVVLFAYLVVTGNLDTSSINSIFSKKLSGQEVSQKTTSLGSGMSGISSDLKSIEGRLG
jgi:hypothetical protein